VIARSLIREFDAVVRRAHGVCEFTDDPSCLFRVRLTQLRGPCALKELVLPVGSPMLEIHLWNEHIPAMPPGGPDAKWAVLTDRRLRRSLNLLAQLIQNGTQFGGARAIGGPTTLLTGRHSHALLERLGFQVVPGDPSGAISGFFQDLYRSALVWSFNPPALRLRKSIRFPHDEIWMTTAGLLDRYGGGPISDSHR
jgi:hypothetical protein